jgi:hypothetical protein
MIDDAHSVPETAAQVRARRASLSINAHRVPCERCGEEDHCACMHGACCECGSKEHSTADHLELSGDARIERNRADTKANQFYATKP